MTTGEIANGMSISGFRIALPRNFWRTRTIAARIPNAVLSGTAMTTVINVSFKAWMRVLVGDRVPGGLSAVVEGPEEDHHHRDQQQGREVEEDSEAEPVAA